MTVEAMRAPETTQTEGVYARLRHDIIAGERKPGERLRIDRLRKLYNVGPTPLREALQRLSADGLVLIAEYRGFQVAPLRADAFHDLNIARIAVETKAVELAILKGDEHWEAAIVAALYRLDKADRMLALDRAANLDAWEESNRAFHDATVAACGSSWLLRVRRLLHDQCERYRRVAVHGERLSRDLAEEHRRIKDAVLARDVGRAVAEVTEHFERTARGLETVLPGEGP